MELVKENELTTKHAILDEHSDRVKHFMDHLQQLVPMLKNTLYKLLARSTCISKELLKLLHFIMMELMSMNNSVHSVASGPGIHTCLIVLYEG